MSLWKLSPLFFNGLGYLERSQLAGSWQKLFQCHELIIKTIGGMSLHGFYLTSKCDRHRDKEIQKGGGGQRKRVKNPVDPLLLFLVIRAYKT